MAVAPDVVLKELKKNVFHPIYFLHGDEPYYIEAIAAQLESRVVAESDRSFNQFVLYGKDTDVTGVLGNARRFPFISERQLVIVKEAQRLGGLDQKEQQKRLEEYANHPVPSTVLVFCHQAPADERKAFMKAIGNRGVVVQSKKMYDNKLPDWVADYCHQAGVKISPKAIQMLVDFIGNDLKRISNEIQKIMVNLKAGEPVDAGTVEKYVGISKEYNVFEFQKALQQRDILKANSIVLYFSGNKKDNPLAPVLIILFSFFTKVLMVHAAPDRSERAVAAHLGVNPFFAKDYLAASRAYPYSKTVRIISYIRAADARLKGVEGGTVDEGELLRDLVFKILH